MSKGKTQAAGNNQQANRGRVRTRRNTFQRKCISKAWKRMFSTMGSDRTWRKMVMRAEGLLNGPHPLVDENGKIRGDAHLAADKIRKELEAGKRSELLSLKAA